MVIIQFNCILLQVLHTFVCVKYANFVPLVSLVAKTFFFLRLQNFVLTSRHLVLLVGILWREQTKLSAGNLLVHVF